MFEVKTSEGRQQTTVFSAVAFHLPTWNEAMCLLVHRWSAYGLLARLARWHDPHMLDMYLSCSPGKEHTTKHSQRALSKIFPEDWMTICLALSIWVNHIPLWPMEPVWSYWCEWQHLMCATRISWSAEPNAKASQKQGGEAFDAESCGSLTKKKVSLTFFSIQTSCTIWIITFH